MDFQKLINDETKKYVDKKLPEHVQKHLDSMIDSILGDIFGRYGDNKKQIQKVISEKIKIDVTDLKLIDYNGMIATAIQSRFNDLIKENSVKPILDLVSDTVGEKYKKDEISLDELFDEVREMTIDDDDLHYGDEGKVSFYAKYNSEYNWIKCRADSREGTDRDSCEIVFMFSTDNKRGRIFSLNLSSYAGKLKSTMDITRLGGVEKLIHKIWTSGVKITIDDDYNEDQEIDFDRDFCIED